jgi:hypothetical protein
VPRTVTVDAARLPRWVAGFGERHGAYDFASTATGFALRAADGESADVVLPYLPWAGSGVDDAAAHLAAARRTAVLIVRRGGYACAVVEGDAVTASKVGSRYVQGRTAAGGWSQQRFARRREKQTGELAGSSAEVAARVLLPVLGQVPAGTSVWVATGGDKPLIERVLADPRLRTLATLPRGPHLAVGDPDRTLVRALPGLLTTVHIHLA